MNTSNKDILSFLEDVLVQLAKELPPESFDIASETLIREIQYHQIQSKIYTPLEGTLERIQKKIVRRLDTLLACSTQQEVRSDNQIKFIQNLHNHVVEAEDNLYSLLDRLESSLSQTKNREPETLQNELQDVKQNLAKLPDYVSGLQQKLTEIEQKLAQDGLQKQIAETQQKMQSVESVLEKLQLSLEESREQQQTQQQSLQNIQDKLEATTQENKASDSSEIEELICDLADKVDSVLAKTQEAPELDLSSFVEEISEKLEAISKQQATGNQSDSPELQESLAEILEKVKPLESLLQLKEQIQQLPQTPQVDLSEIRELLQNNSQGTEQLAEIKALLQGQSSDNEQLNEIKTLLQQQSSGDNLQEFLGQFKDSQSKLESLLEAQETNKVALNSFLENLEKIENYNPETFSKRLNNALSSAIELIEKNLKQNVRPKDLDTIKLNVGTLETTLWRIEQRLEEDSSWTDLNELKKNIQEALVDSSKQIMENFDSKIIEHIESTVGNKLSEVMEKTGPSPEKITSAIESQLSNFNKILTAIEDRMLTVLEREIKEKITVVLEEKQTAFLEQTINKIEERVVTALAQKQTEEMEKSLAKIEERISLSVQNQLEASQSKTQEIVEILRELRTTGKADNQSKMVSKCPHCTKEATAPASFRGKQVICRHCNQKFMFP